MLLNVSRTPAPESWLANLETEPPSYSALDKEAYVTLDKSRFNISSIDSELFPELLSWSALMNALSHTRSQSIPSDITKPDTDTFRETVTIHQETNAIHEDDADTIDEGNLLLSSILDRTTLMAGFDQSCFDGLDDLIIHDPFEAFAEMCWEDAVGHNGSTPSMRATTPTQQLPNKPTGRRKLPSLSGITRISTERDGDVGKDRTYTNYDEEPVSPSDCPSSPSEENLRTMRNTLLSTFSDDDEATSFVIFEAPVLSPNRYDSVGHYPIPSSRPYKKVASNRIATFCSNLPAPFSPVM
jgi:hypothetical protein